MVTVNAYYALFFAWTVVEIHTSRFYSLLCSSFYIVYNIEQMLIGEQMVGNHCPASGFVNKNGAFHLNFLFHFSMV